MSIRLSLRARIFGIFLVLAALADPIPGAAQYSVPDDIPKLIEAGNIPEAKRRLQEFRRKEPANPLAIFYLARIESDRDFARALYKEVERLAEPGMAAEAIFARASMHIEEGDYLAAEPLLVKVVTTHPSGQSYADALYALGMIRLKSGRIGDALVQFQNSRDAHTEGFRKTLASAGILECYVAQEDWNRVLDTSREVLSGRDDTGALTPRVLEAVALAWSRLGNKDNAEKFTMRLLNDFPRSYQAYTLRAKGDRVAGETAYTLGQSPPGTESPAPEPSAPPPPASEPPDISPESPPQGGFTVQAGAFVNRFNALKVYNRLKDSGLPVRVDMKTVGDRHFYLVRIGSYSTRDAADDTALRVSRITGTRATVVMVE